MARTNSFVRESKEQSQCYHGQAKLVRATNPGALGTQEKISALSRGLGPNQTLLNVTSGHGTKRLLVAYDVQSGAFLRAEFRQGIARNLMES